MATPILSEDLKKELEDSEKPHRAVFTGGRTKRAQRQEKGSTEDVKTLPGRVRKGGNRGLQ